MTFKVKQTDYDDAITTNNSQYLDATIKVARDTVANNDKVVITHAGTDRPVAVFSTSEEIDGWAINTNTVLRKLHDKNRQAQCKNQMICSTSSKTYVGGVGIKQPIFCALVCVSFEDGRQKMGSGCGFHKKELDCSKYAYGQPHIE